MNTLNVSTEVSATEVESLIAQLVASYDQPTPAYHALGSTTPALVKVVRSVTKAPKMPKTPKGTKVAPVVVKAQATSIRDARPMTLGVALPTAGTIDAKGFLVAMRRSVTRGERINAIASYIGYNMAELHGTQEMNANMKAHRAVRGEPGTVVGSVKPVYSTFVGGTPTPMSRKFADLKAREVLTVEAILDFNRQASVFTEVGDGVSANYMGQLAAIESERLAHIKDELASM
jgi:hypothetical protein